MKNKTHWKKKGHQRAHGMQPVTTFTIAIEKHNTDVERKGNRTRPFTNIS